MPPHLLDGLRVGYEDNCRVPGKPELEERSMLLAPFEHETLKLCSCGEVAQHGKHVAKTQQLWRTGGLRSATNAMEQ